MVALAAALGVANIAHASIPPSYRVVVVASEHEDEAVNRALVEAMSAQQAFFWVRGELHLGDLAPCLAAADAAACVRAAVAAKPGDPNVRTVVVVASPEAEARFAWRCFGEGAAAPASASVDVQAALFGADEAQVANLRAAMGCIAAAAASR